MMAVVSFQETKEMRIIWTGDLIFTAVHALSVLPCLPGGRRLTDRSHFCAGSRRMQDRWGMQKLLMEAEGMEVEYTQEGFKVDLKWYGWKSTMEDALRFRELFEMKGI